MTLTKDQCIVLCQSLAKIASELNVDFLNFERCVVAFGYDFMTIQKQKLELIMVDESIKGMLRSLGVVEFLISQFVLDCITTALDKITGTLHKVADVRNELLKEIHDYHVKEIKALVDLIEKKKWPEPLLNYAFFCFYIISINGATILEEKQMVDEIRFRLPDEINNDS
jgi:hypothetical protein